MFDSPPKDWKELQAFVHKIYTEMGCHAEIEKPVETTRGKDNIDVYVEDNVASSRFIYLCECKFWERRVPKSVIHSFRSIMVDIGANAGYIISKEGFQSGAYKVAEKTNVSLLSWNEFQEMYDERWTKVMCEELAEHTQILANYLTDPSRAENFPKKFENDILYKFRDLCKPADRLVCTWMGQTDLAAKGSFPVTFFHPDWDTDQSEDIVWCEVNSKREYFDLMLPRVIECRESFERLIGRIHIKPSEILGSHIRL